MASKTSASWSEWTKMHRIALLVEQGLDRTAVYAALRPHVRDQTKPFVFTFNPGMGQTRQPLPIHKQYKRLWWTIGKTLAEMGRDVDELEQAPEETELNPQTPVVVPAVSEAKENEVSYFLRRVSEVREFCKKRAEIAEPLDEITLRPIQDGVSGILAGISADAMLASMVLHWPEDAKAEAGIRKVDFTKESPHVGDNFHHMTGYILKLAQARIPIMLVGPAGTGKSTVLRQCSDLMELPYGECPMTAGATPSWLLGAETMKGYKTRPCMERLALGGFFNFEEIDASDANMLLVSNQILSAESYFNPVTGDEIVKHENFVVCSTANTFGLGATRAFSARERLDDATRDRWRMGRVWIDFDPAVGRFIAERLCQGTDFQLS
jgi:hypothetical protein